MILVIQNINLQDLKKSGQKIHPATQCDNCKTEPIVGVRYEKLDLMGFSKYDLCESCHKQVPDIFDANFLKIPIPLDREIQVMNTKAPPTVSAHRSSVGPMTTSSPSTSTSSINSKTL